MSICPSLQQESETISFGSLREDPAGPHVGRILMVDDSTVMLSTIRACLEGLPAEFVSTTEPAEAIALAKEEKFALILLDVVIPQMHGFELATRIRSENCNRTTPIIFVTGEFVTDIDQLKGYELGAVDYIVKPFDPAILWSKVDVFLTLHEQRQVLEREIGERRRAEELLRSHQDRLEHIVEERTQELKDLNADLQREIRENQRHQSQLELFRTVLDQASDAIFIIVPETGTVIDHNRTAGTALGYRSEELLGMHAWELTTCWADVDIWRRHVEDLSTRNVLILDAKQCCRDGSTVPVEVTVKLVHNGQSPYVLVVLRDISARKLAERKLRESEARYRLLAENTTDMISRHDAKGHFLDVSPACFDMLGYTAEDLQDRSVFDYVYPDDLDNVRAYFRSAMSGRNHGTITYQMRRDDGGYTWLETSTRSFAPFAGKEREIVAVSRDVSGRMETEAKQRRLATIIEQTHESVMITDPDGAIEYVNPAFEAAYGYKSDEVLGQDSAILRVDVEDEHDDEELWKSLRQGKVWKGRLTNRRKDRSAFIESATFSPVRDHAGRIINYVAVKRDISHEVALEAQLRQAQKMEAIGRLAGGIAHDFNNILTVILGHCQLLLLAMKENDGYRGKIEVIQKAGSRAASLTGQLLAFSRKQVLKVQTIELNQLIFGLEIMLRRTIGENIELIIDYGPDLHAVKADHAQLEQMFMNLVINARDAMEHSEHGKLNIKTRNVALSASESAKFVGLEAGDYVCLVVRDNGCGIPEGLKNKIFEPFFTTKPEGQGTGLGLSSVFGFVEQSGGSIAVDSKVSQGTAFTIYLPAVDEPADIIDVDSDVLTGEETGTETILLVEDEELVNSMISETLEEVGYTVMHTTKPEDALEICKSYAKPIDLLITDLIMPGINGVQLARQVKDMRDDVLVAFMSGYPERRGADSERLDELGEFFLQKPFTPSLLLKKIHGVFAGRGHSAVSKDMSMAGAASETQDRTQDEAVVNHGTSES